LVIPQFHDTYSYCQQLQWNCDDDKSFTNCSSRYQDGRNRSVITNAGTFTQDGQTVQVDSACLPNATAGGASSYCLNCEELGGYRTTTQGLGLLVIALGFVGIALYFLPKAINVKV